MDNPLDDFLEICKIQDGNIKALEESEAGLMEARDLLNEANRKQDELSEKDLLITLIKANSSMLASMICQNQSIAAGAKQSQATLKQAIKKMKDGMSDFGKMMQDQMGESPFGDSPPPFDDEEDDDEENTDDGLPLN